MFNNIRFDFVQNFNFSKLKNFRQINWLALKLKAYKCLRNVPNKSAIEKNLNFKITIETNRRPFHKGLTILF